MPRLVANPGTPHATEIQLKPGANVFGRAAGSDFKLDDPSISGTHCHIMVADGVTTITDLGSTNGTFVNKSPVREAVLQPGQTVRLGEFELLYEPDAAPPVAANSRPPSRIAVKLHAAAPAEPVVEEEPPLANVMPTGPVFCKSHIKSPAQWMCRKCNKYFCPMCVSTRRTGNVQHHTCRKCGSECVPVQTGATRSAEKSFFTKLPGAFIYPFRGFGAAILILAAMVFSALNFLRGGMGILITIGAYGFLFLFMQNILHSTASDEGETLSLPTPDSLGGAFLQLVGTLAMSFWLLIGLLIAGWSGIEIPGPAYMAAAVLGCLYAPMCFLAVAMKDTVVAGNPLIVFPAILKMPLEYGIATLVLLSALGVRQLGGLLSGVAGAISMSTRDMSVLFAALGLQALWSLASIYLLTVCMRILGLLYNSKKQKLGWFNY